MFFSMLSVFLFLTPLKYDTSIDKKNDSLKLAYYNYMLDGPNPANTFIPFKIVDSSGKTWWEMINWGDVKTRFYPVVGNNHKAFKTFVSSILCNENVLTQQNNFGNMGFVIHEGYAQLIKDIPLDVFFSIYLDKRGILKREYYYITPEVMSYLFNHQVKFFQSPNLSVHVDFEFWKEYIKKQGSSKL